MKPTKIPFTENFYFTHKIPKEDKEERFYYIQFNISELMDGDNHNLVYELIAAGDIKWDGCSNWEFNNYVHFCTKENMDELNIALKFCYDKAGEIFRNDDQEWFDE